VKLITLNIEGDRHLETVLPFLLREKPDVLCLQEVFFNTVQRIASLGYTYEFLPMTHKIQNGEDCIAGTAIFVARDIQASYRTEYYHAPPGDLPLYDPARNRETIRHGIVFAQFEYQGNQYLLGSTHFTWVERGEEPSPEQAQDLKALIALTAKEPAHILCGDFNIPRGYNALYNSLHASYVDAIPPHYTSSLDKTLHRLGDNPEKQIMFDSFMVDYIFSQPPYAVSDVRLEFGISDHAAVIGTVK
jgi:endonuclease/exonuclease/phosphatase family metal-dependent hydrolase